MSNIERYAVWCSSQSDHNAIMDNFVDRKSGCRFENSFNLKDQFIDYDHAIVIWYGESQGELGHLSRKDNPALDPYFDFITEPISVLLESMGIREISYLLALPELEYTGKKKDNGVLFFAGNIACERQASDWLNEILSGM